jgi:tungstate transport system substrate-binding protein
MNRRILLGCLLAAALSAPAFPQEKSIVVASTTSTQDSGLFGHILPIFKAKTGIDVKVIAQGTGQALDTGKRGDADVVFVHAKPQEEKFVTDGWAVKRYAVMYNDFVLVGPKSDPAGVRGKDIQTALKAIKAKAAPFVSRGDRSGTHAAELALWKAAGADPHPNPPPHSPSKTGVNALSLEEGREGARPWYREIGQGMGAALNTAAAMNGYTLADRGTWLSFRNRGELDIVVEGDKRLFNQYGVMLVNPARHPHVKAALGQQFIDWLISPEGQRAIANYKINGQQLFFPNATVPDA